MEVRRIARMVIPFMMLILVSVPMHCLEERAGSALLMQRGDTKSGRHLLSRSSIFIEKATAQDAQEAMEWFLKTECNLLDAAVFTYPATETRKAVRDKVALVYVPVQKCSVLDALGISPQNSPIDTAAALAELVKVARWEAHKAGEGELLFVCHEESTIAYAERHGFTRWLWDEEKKMGLFRMRIL